MAARTPVVARLLALSDVGGQELEADFVKHVLERYSERHALVIQYLHELILQDGFAQGRGTAGKGAKEGAQTARKLPARYAKVLHTILEGLIRRGSSGSETATSEAQRVSGISLWRGGLATACVLCKVGSCVWFQRLTKRTHGHAHTRSC